MYYIKDNSGRFLSNTNVNGSGGTPTFKEVKNPRVSQEWKIVTDASGKNCYKITSNADKRYMNEYGVFGTNQYYSDWNTYLLTLMGDKWSIRWTQSAAKNGAQYIVVSGDRLEAKNVAGTESYTLTIVDKDGNTAIESIDEGSNGILVEEGAIAAVNNCNGIAVYSADGKLVKSAKGNSIATTGISQGIYIVVTDDNNGTTQHKVVIK